MKAKKPGADAIVVSNHGGRVLDQCPATAGCSKRSQMQSMAPMKIFVDGHPFR